MDVFGDPAPAVAALARADPALRLAIDAIGAPVIRRRQAGFAGMFRIIVEQQVSVPSAQAIWRRCLEGLDTADAAAVGLAGADRLREFGLSRPKAVYVADLARKVAAGDIDMAAIAGLDDDAAIAALTAIRGVGPWTAAIYLLFCEGRADIWPSRDVALRGAFREAASAPELSQEELDAYAQRWAPFRGVAAHILWTYYAQIRGRAPI